MKTYNYIKGGVCAAKGFLANGVHCGLYADTNKNDIALLYSERICTAAAVYTTNKVKGAPIIVTKKHLDTTGGKARAVIANSRNANTCNSDGEEKAERMCSLAAERLGIDVNEVLVASTGVIGQILPIEPIEKGMDSLCKGLSADGNLRAESAIMTTDTVPKEYAVEFMSGGKVCHIGGMAKGSGMIHPNMATTLNFITTDAAVSSDMIQTALSDVVRLTYNCLSVDGDTSTNDMVLVMANGVSGASEITDFGEDYTEFRNALYIVMKELTKMLAKDGEGATKLLECTCTDAPSLDTAIQVAKSVVGSTLFKCAIFGEDANWGRILCAVGYTDAEFDIDKVDVYISSANGRINVCKNGKGVEFSEDEAKTVLSADEITVGISLNSGEYSASAWGCDLTYDYVKINGDYRS